MWPGNRNLSIDDAANQVGTLFAALDLHHLRAAFFHEARGIADGVFGVNMIRPVGHVSQQQRALHAAAHRLHMVQHLVHSDRERVVVTKNGLGERVADQNHLDAGFIHQARGGVVVGGEAGNGFATEFLFPQSSGGDLLAARITTRKAGTPAHRGDAHFSSSAPPARPDRACSASSGMLR